MVIKRLYYYLIKLVFLAYVIIGFSLLEAKKTEINPDFVYQLETFSDKHYEKGVEVLLKKMEKSHNRTIHPGSKKKVGIKTYTHSGPGLCTPLPLIKGLIKALEKRGFKKQDIFIVDYSENQLRKSNILPPLSQKSSEFQGVQVYALDSHRYWDIEWFYESNLPSLDYFEYLFKKRNIHTQESRKSYLNVLLLCDVDFWINLPMAVYHPCLELSGALINATLLNISNHRRFLNSKITGSIAAQEIAMIPEFKNTLLCSIISLERYQYAGGYTFNAYYTKSDPILILAEDMQSLDDWLLQKIKEDRSIAQFKETPTS